MSGDKVWVHGAVERDQMIADGQNLDAISGETILGSLAQNKEAGYEVMDMFYGFIPGSVGETSTILILLGCTIFNLYKNRKLENHVVFSNRCFSQWD